MRSRSGRSAASTFSAPTSAHTILRGLERHRARGAARHLAGAVRRAGRAGRPTRSRWCSRSSSLSYRELDARANQLAHHLRALGVGPEVVVGLCVERSLEMLVGLLGILKAGGAYLPLDPDYPRERLAFMLADAGAPVLVTQSALLDRLPAHGARIVRLDADWPTIAQQPTTAPGQPRSHPHNPAYVIYTSGSTGTPKGRRGHARRPCQQARGAAEQRLRRRRPTAVGAAQLASRFDARSEQICCR